MKMESLPRGGWREREEGQKAEVGGSAYEKSI